RLFLPLFRRQQPALNYFGQGRERRGRSIFRLCASGQACDARFSHARDCADKELRPKAEPRHAPVDAQHVGGGSLWRIGPFISTGQALT
ncbi:MAG TPA: hypothetical protein VEV81_02340, partial [Pyrinomonadaceae bacterium]|nr:hypothetical protein [Pyrinomonadaceae bacterium]